MSILPLPVKFFYLRNLFIWTLLFNCKRIKSLGTFSHIKRKYLRHNFFTREMKTSSFVPMLSLMKYFHSVVSNANISVAKASDIPELVRLINSAYRNNDSVKGWTNEAELFEGSRATPDSLKYLLDQPQSAILK